MGNIPEPRYTELDSLCGVTAPTGAFHHFRMLWMPGSGRSNFTLLNPITAGHKTVMLSVFLSGFVLSVPMLCGRGQRYPIYFLRRVLRIYGPYLFALVLAVLCAAKWHGPLPEGGNWAKLTWSQPVTSRLVLASVLIMPDYDWSQYNKAFWSLVIEMRISILFSRVVCPGETIRNEVVCGFGDSDDELCFAVRGSLARDGADIGHDQRWSGLCVGHSARDSYGTGECVASHSEPDDGVGDCSRGALPILVGHHIAGSLHLESAGLNNCLITAAAAGYMILAMNAPLIRRILNSKMASWLGWVSYSLYLVHGTVLFALAHALCRRAGLMLSFTLSISGSLVLAYFFNLVMEEPFLKLSCRVARLDKAQCGAISARVATPSPGA